MSFHGKAIGQFDIIQTQGNGNCAFNAIGIEFFAYLEEMKAVFINPSNEHQEFLKNFIEDVAKNLGIHINNNENSIVAVFDELNKLHNNRKKQQYVLAIPLRNLFSAWQKGNWEAVDDTVYNQMCSAYDLFHQNKKIPKKNSDDTFFSFYKDFAKIKEEINAFLGLTHAERLSKLAKDGILNLSDWKEPASDDALLNHLAMLAFKTDQEYMTQPNKHKKELEAEIITATILKKYWEKDGRKKYYHQTHTQTWGGNFELAILATVLKVNLVINHIGVQSSTTEPDTSYCWQHPSEALINRPTFYLYHQNNHYQAMLPKSTPNHVKKNSKPSTFSTDVFLEKSLQQTNKNKSSSLPLISTEKPPIDAHTQKDIPQSHQKTPETIVEKLVSSSNASSTEYKTETKPKKLSSSSSINAQKEIEDILSRIEITAEKSQPTTESSTKIAYSFCNSFWDSYLTQKLSLNVNQDYLVTKEDQIKLDHEFAKFLQDEDQSSLKKLR